MYNKFLCLNFFNIKILIKQQKGDINYTVKVSLLEFEDTSSPEMPHQHSNSHSTSSTLQFSSRSSTYLVKIIPRSVQVLPGLQSTRQVPRVNKLSKLVQMLQGLESTRQEIAEYCCSILFSFFPWEQNGAVFTLLRLCTMEEQNYNAYT